MTNDIPHCPHRADHDVDIKLLLACDRLEKAFKDTLYFTSGVRCKECNAAAGGVANSAHLTGQAVDILIISGARRMDIIRAALSCGFRRIGIGKDFIHVDVSTILPQDVIWTY